MNSLPKIGDKIIFNENLKKLVMFNNTSLIGSTGVVSFIDKANYFSNFNTSNFKYKIYIKVDDLGRTLFLYDQELYSIDLLEDKSQPKTNDDTVEVNKDNYSLPKYKYSYSNEESSVLEELDDALLSINNSSKSDIPEESEENYHTKFKLNDLVYVNEDNSKYFFSPDLMLYKVFNVVSINKNQFNICNVHNIHDKFYLPVHYVKFFSLFGGNKKYKSKRKGGNHPLTNMFISDKLTEEKTVN